MAQYEITNIPAPIDFECGSIWAKRVVQNAKNLLMCRKGEVPFDRQRGLDPALFELPISETQRRLLPELDRVMFWENGVTVVSGSARIEDGETVIRCVIEVEE